MIILTGFLAATLIIFCTVCCYYYRKARIHDEQALNNQGYDPCASLMMSGSKNNYRSASTTMVSTGAVRTQRKSSGSPTVPMETETSMDDSRDTETPYTISIAGDGDDLSHDLYTPGAITQIQIGSKRKRTMKLPTSIFPEYHNKRYHRRRKRKLLPQYTMEEVSQHNQETSCWIVVDNLVLDATNFLQYHPAGRRSILNVAGTRCDTHFDFHSNAAQQLFFKFVIGRVQGPKQNCLTM